MQELERGAYKPLFLYFFISISPKKKNMKYVPPLKKGDKGGFKNLPTSSESRIIIGTLNLHFGRLSASPL